MRTLLLILSVLCFGSCKTSLITYQNGYIFDKQGETIGNYTNGIFIVQRDYLKDIIPMGIFMMIITIL